MRDRVIANPFREGGDTTRRLTVRDVLVIADDLSGAAESVAAIASGSSISCDLRLVGAEPLAEESPCLVIDTDSRHLPGSTARARVRVALTARASATLVFKKVDSLLRGQISSETAELSADGLRIIATFALPSLARTVVGGIIRVAGVPLDESDAWSSERGRPPPSVLTALDSPAARLVPLDVVRGTGLDAALTRALEAETVPVCDAADQSDLDRIVDAALRLLPHQRVALLGTGALARALGQRLTPVHAVQPSSAPARANRVLVVVGTLAPVAAEQVRRLAAAGAEHVLVTHHDLIDDNSLRALSARIRRAIRCGTAVVSFDHGSPWHRDQLARMATAVPGALDGQGSDFVLTGGETARRVLEALDVSTIHPRTELVAGAVLSTLPGDGHFVVTRPGSFGSPDDLVEIVARLGKCTSHGRE